MPGWPPGVPPVSGRKWPASLRRKQAHASPTLVGGRAMTHTWEGTENGKMPTSQFVAPSRKLCEPHWEPRKWPVPDRFAKVSRGESRRARQPLPAQAVCGPLTPTFAPRATTVAALDQPFR